MRLWKPLLCAVGTSGTGAFSQEAGRRLKGGHIQAAITLAHLPPSTAPLAGGEVLTFFSFALVASYIELEAPMPSPLRLRLNDHSFSEHKSARLCLSHVPAVQGGEGAARLDYIEAERLFRMGGALGHGKTCQVSHCNVLLHLEGRSKPDEQQQRHQGKATGREGWDGGQAAPSGGSSHLAGAIVFGAVWEHHMDPLATPCQLHSGSSVEAGRSGGNRYVVCTTSMLRRRGKQGFGTIRHPAIGRWSRKVERFGGDG